MLNKIWKFIKQNSLVRVYIGNSYYYIKNVRQSIYGVGNSIQINLESKFSFIQNTRFNIKGNRNTVLVGSNVRLNTTTIQIDGDDNKIVLEDNIQGSVRLWISGNNCQILIGKNTTIRDANIGVAEANVSANIGDDCMLADGIDIRCSDSHSIIDLKSNQRINYAKDINIGSHVWIGRNVQILKGVSVGKDSIIASGAILTKEYPSNSIIAGIPAQVKRTNVTWSRENMPEHSKLA